MSLQYLPVDVGPTVTDGRITAELLPTATVLVGEAFTVVAAVCRWTDDCSLCVVEMETFSVAREEVVVT